MSNRSIFDTEEGAQLLLQLERYVDARQKAKGRRFKALTVVAVEADAAGNLSADVSWIGCTCSACAIVSVRSLGVAFGAWVEEVGPDEQRVH